MGINVVRDRSIRSYSGVVSVVVAKQPAYISYL